MENKNKIPSDTLDLIYHETKDQLKNQFQALENLNTKASIILGFVAVLLGIIFTNKPIMACHRYCFFIMALILFFISLFSAFFAYKVEDYRLGPDPDALYEHYRTDESDEVKEQVIVNFIESFKENQKRIGKRADRVNVSIFTLCIGLILFVISKLIN
ncbi:hypothetical protein BEH94_10885 [Candidatus Altiarchaeales archaeon WOR_SM1_SCG]|nr:hypothetical protein BEH94_10885 [Candidatus Altiarchaeales archaeon WOR_SM1_SCG]